MGKVDGGIVRELLQIPHLGDDCVLALQQHRHLTFQLFLSPGELFLDAVLHHGGLPVGRRDLRLRLLRGLGAQLLGRLDGLGADPAGLLAGLGDLHQRVVMLGGRICQEGGDLLGDGGSLAVGGREQQLSLLVGLAPDPLALGGGRVAHLLGLGSGIVEQLASLVTRGGLHLLGIAAGLLGKLTRFGGRLLVSQQSVVAAFLNNRECLRTRSVQGGAAVVLGGLADPGGFVVELLAHGAQVSQSLDTDVVCLGLGVRAQVCRQPASFLLDAFGLGGRLADQFTRLGLRRP